MSIKAILHIPHSSVLIPDMSAYTVSKEIIDSEILKLTDWYTDDLFHSEEDEMIVAGFSRIFCDVERFTDDSQEVMAQYGMGVLYEKSDEGNTIRNVSPGYKENVLRDYYLPHHQRLNEAVNNQLRLYEKALIIDCHSFPHIPLKRALSQNPNQPDFNIGTDSFHTPDHLTERAVRYFEKLGYSLGVDWPYSGSIVPMEHYKKSKNVHTMMLEINRKLYLKVPGNEKSERYDEIKRIIKELIKKLKNSL